MFVSMLNECVTGRVSIYGILECLWVHCVERCSYTGVSLGVLYEGALWDACVFTVWRSIHLNIDACF